jgi:hypothetical protein
MTMAAGPGSTDAENGVTMAARDRFRGAADDAEPGAGPEAEAPAPQGAQRAAGLEVYGDSAYGSGEARAGSRDAGHDTVISPGRCARPCPAGSPWIYPGFPKARP